MKKQIPASSNKPVIGIALGSGAAKGWSQIGILETLEAEGISADIVAGTSIGAFVGAAYVGGALETLRDWTLSLRWTEVARMLDVSFHGGGLIEGSEVIGLLKRLGVEGPIEDMAKHFVAVTTDYRSGREVWLESGEITDAVRASIALPGILTPKQVGDTWYLDGGLVNPVPVSACRALGATFVIAVNLNGDIVSHTKQKGNGRKRVSNADKAAKKEGTQSTENSGSGIAEMMERPLSALPASWKEGTLNTVNQIFGPKASKPGYFEILAYSINIMQDRITRSRLAGDPPHILMTPRLGAMGIFDFDDAKNAIEEGRRCAKHALPEIRYQLEMLGMSN